jgi:uncharacterized protein YqhQ
MEKKRPNIGGQAVMEGVMMRNDDAMAVTVRREDGNMTMKEYGNKQKAEKPWYKKALFIRGVTNFISMMKLGIGCLNDSVKMLGLEEEEPSKFEKWLSKKTNKDIMEVLTAFSLVIGIGLAIGLFFLLPNLITSWVSKGVESSLAVNFIEGGIRLAIFIGYIVLISQMKDIKRFFGYHGAEHKTINSFEAGEKLTVENVQKHTTYHPRCGTSFLVLVMILAVLVFSLTGWNGQSVIIRLLIRLALLPVVAALSYEMLMFLAKFDNAFTKVLTWPGKQLQKLTTREPDDDMVKAAIASALAVMDEYWYEKAAPEGYEFPNEFSEEENKQNEETEKEDVELDDKQASN